MNNTGRWTGFMVVATLLLLAASCTSKKKLVQPNHTMTYEWMTAKMTMDVSVEGVELNNVQGTLRMRRDSVIWISVSPMMGLEGLRALVTKDSILVVDRVDKTYLYESLDYLVSQWNISQDFEEFQRMLLGEGDMDHVVLHFGIYNAKIKYSDIHWDEPTTFPIKINNKYQRINLKI